MNDFFAKAFTQLAKQDGVILTLEHKFHPTRRWRFDFADIEKKIAIEFEGGIWVAGRHTRGTGYRNDTIKYNEAAKLGWRILRYCTEDDLYSNWLVDYKAILDNK